MKQPHVLLITSDQHRADCLGCAGHPVVRTPHLDQLAREGTRFTRASTECPVCIPARTGLLTGIHAANYGMPAYADQFRFDRPREQLLGGLMTHAGYQTAIVGKRHWHRDPSCTGGFEQVVPIERCKREQSLASGGWGFPSGCGANELSPALFPLDQRLYSTNWIVDRCCELLMERDQTRPLFLWCSILDPHPPIAIHEPYYSMYRDADIPEPVVGDWVDGDDCPLPHREHALSWGGRLGPAELRDATAVYYGMITNVDHQLGRLFGMLQRLGMWQDTLVIYTSDHGEMMGDHRDAGKSSFYRSSSDIPSIVRAPADWQAPIGQESDALIGLTDLLPTIVSAGGGAVPDDIDGNDLGAIVRGESEKVRDVFVGAIDGRYLVDDGHHRWLYHVADGSQQLFAASDRRDENPLPLDEAIVAPLRDQLVAFLQESKCHDLEDGQLANHGRTASSLEEMRAKNAAGWGHAGRHLGFSGPV